MKSIEVLAVAHKDLLGEVTPAIAAAGITTLHLATGIDAALNKSNTIQPGLALIDTSFSADAVGQLLRVLSQASPRCPIMLLGTPHASADAARHYGRYLRTAQLRAVPAPIDAHYLGLQIIQILEPGLHGRRQIAGMLECGDLRLDMDASVATLENRTAYLTAAEMNLLGMLMRQSGNLVSREQLRAGSLAGDAAPKDRSLDTHMSNLRRKLGLPNGRHAGKPQIRSFRGRGYALVGYCMAMLGMLPALAGAIE